MQSDHHSAATSEATSPRRKAGRPARRPKARVSSAAESGDRDLDEEPTSAKRNQLPQQVVEKVVIPINGRSSLASSLSSVLDQSSEYDTPDTSMIVTPAESIAREERSLICPKRMSSNISSCQPKEPFMGKRKRLEVDKLVETDALLAQKLQEQEYGKAQEMASRSGQARNALIDDSEESLLSDLSREHSPHPDNSPKLETSAPGRSYRRRSKALLSQTAPADVEVDWSRSRDEFLDGDEAPKFPVPGKKRIKINDGTSLPARAARVSVNECITDSTSRGILDYEDSDLSNHSDDVSFFDSDLVSDASEDSEDADGEAGNIVGAANSLTTAVAARNLSSAANAPPATSRRGTGRRGASPTQAANPTRGRRSWQRRVEDRVSSELLLIPHRGLRHNSGCKRATKTRESSSRNQDYLDRSQSHRFNKAYESCAT